jgi:flavin reductase (DIM6/NTAB) family NADH-FMN oxidoreductase RutF
VSESASQEDFRDVIGHFATGVTIVTATDSGRHYGTTVSAVSSVSRFEGEPILYYRGQVGWLGSGRQA